MHPHDPTTSPIWHPTPAERATALDRRRRTIGRLVDALHCAACLALLAIGIWGAL